MALVEVKGKKYSVIGGGVSGIAVSTLLRNNGAEVFVSEKSDSADKQAELEKLSGAGITWEMGKHSVEPIVSVDAIVVSPGVFPPAPVLFAAMQKNVPIYSEVEVAHWFCNAPIVGITGTNGKTTVTSLLGHILQKSGMNVGVAGNIGTPFSAVVERPPRPEIFVLELSSYQLERIDSFHARMAIILNISPDHLERYRDMDEYIKAKFQITRNQISEDYFIYNADDVELSTLAEQVAARRIRCSLKESENDGIYSNGENLYFRRGESIEKLMPREHIPLRGNHNLYNIMTCAAAARLLGVMPETIDSAVSTFQNIGHRIEYVLSLKGRTFINDSKGTNVDAVYAALQTIDAPIILIAGGKDKHSALFHLNELIKSKVKSLVLIGEAAERMEKEWSGIAGNIIRVDTLESAVEEAWSISGEGDTILLSPACASFDMFPNYEARGNVFKESVKKLSQRIENEAGK